jgi:hypothetical protein
VVLEVITCFPIVLSEPILSFFIFPSYFSCVFENFETILERFSQYLSVFCLKVKFFRRTEKNDEKMRFFKIGSDSTIGKHVITSKTTTKFACSIQYWLVIKKMFSIINRNLSHFGAKSLEIHDFQLWAAQRSVAAGVLCESARINSELLFYDLLHHFRRF